MLYITAAPFLITLKIRKVENKHEKKNNRKNKQREL